MSDLNTRNYRICAVNENDVWYLSAKGGIHHWQGSEWKPVMGDAADIAVGGGDVYVVNTQGTLYKWVNNDWAMDTTASNVKSLSVTPDGTCWVVNKDGKVLHKTKTGQWDPNEVNTPRGAGPSVPATPPAQKTHVVMDGEWLTTIAAKHNTTVANLVRLNEAKYPSVNAKNDPKQTVKVGWELKLS